MNTELESTEADPIETGYGLQNEQFREQFCLDLAITPIERLVALLQGSHWLASAIRSHDSSASPLLTVCLRRLLLRLHTRTDNSLLVAFWRWYCNLAKLPKLEPLWSDLVVELADTLSDPHGAGEFVKTIQQQEAKFAELLNSRLIPLRESGTTRWAAACCEGVASERLPSRPSQQGSFCKIAVVGDVSLPFARVTGLTCTFKLGRQGAVPYLSNRDAFSNEFLKAIDQIRSDISRFCSLTHNLTTLSDGCLTGASGQLPVAVAQIAADPRRSRLRGSRVLPSWVALSGAINASKGGIASPVNHLDEKCKALAEDGVRVLISPFDGPPRIVHNVLLVSRQGNATQIVRELNRMDLLWPARLSNFIDAPVKTRRRDRIGWLVTAVAFLALLVFIVSLHLSDKYHPTVSFLSGRLHREQFRQLAEQYQKDPPALSTPRPVIDKEPASLLMNEFEVLLDSKFYDLVDWVPLSKEAEIRAARVQPAYFTRLITLRKKREFVGKKTELSARYDTGGFGIDILTEPKDVISVLKSSDWPFDYKVDSLILTRDLTDLGNDGQPFTITLRAIVWNGFQDTIVRGKADEWAASRIVAPTQSLDLSVEMPEEFGKVAVNMALKHWAIDGAATKDSPVIPLGTVRTRVGQIPDIQNAEPGRIYALLWTWLKDWYAWYYWTGVMLSSLAASFCGWLWWSDKAAGRVTRMTRNWFGGRLAVI